MKNWKAHIAYLSSVISIEVKAHQDANATLQRAPTKQASLKGEVQSLSQELKAALDQIHDLSVNLATTRSLLDAAPQGREKETQAGTSR